MNFKIEALQDFYTVAVKFNPSSVNIGEVKQAKDFSEPKTYVYKVAPELELKVGDVVVLDANSLITTAVITEVHETQQIDYNSDTVYKWVISKVDVSILNDIKVREQTMKHNLRLLESQNQRDLIRKAFTSQFGEEALKGLSSPKLNSPFKNLN